MARGLGPGGRGWCMRVERVERVEGEGQGRKQGPSLDEGGAGRELEVPGLAAWRMARGTRGPRDDGLEDVVWVPTWRGRFPQMGSP